MQNLEFDQKLRAPIANFIQWAIYHPLQWKNFDNPDIVPVELMVDEFTIELGKFILMGEHCYRQDPSPIRMYGLKQINIDKEKIIGIGYEKHELYRQFQTLPINASVKILGGYRGIDIILANIAKQFSSIIYIEPDECMLSQVRGYFQDSNIKFCHDEFLCQE